MKFLTVFLTFFSLPLFGNYSSDLIAHVKESIANVRNATSQLDPKILAIEGMSNAPVRKLLNNLCSRVGTSYLEIGCWKGSTFVSALYGNQDSVFHAIAIDDWSEFSGPQEEFRKNCSKFLKDFPFKAISKDCFTVDLDETFDYPINLYFYDGNHSVGAQESAFTYFDSVFDDVFIAVVDDWKYAHVQEGTRVAFKKLGYEVLYETSLPARSPESSIEGYWNGLFVAVLKKPIAS